MIIVVFDKANALVVKALEDREYVLTNLGVAEIKESARFADHLAMSRKSRVRNAIQHLGARYNALNLQPAAGQHALLANIAQNAVKSTFTEQSVVLVVVAKSSAPVLILAKPACIDHEIFTAHLGCRIDQGEQLFFGRQCPQAIHVIVEAHGNLSARECAQHACTLVGVQRGNRLFKATLDLAVDGKRCGIALTRLQIIVPTIVAVVAAREQYVQPKITAITAHADLDKPGGRGGYLKIPGLTKLGILQHDHGIMAAGGPGAHAANAPCALGVMIVGGVHAKILNIAASPLPLPLPRGVARMQHKSLLVKGLSTSSDPCYVARGNSVKHQALFTAVIYGGDALAGILIKRQALHRYRALIACKTVSIRVAVLLAGFKCHSFCCAAVIVVVMRSINAQIIKRVIG